MLLIALIPGCSASGDRPAGSRPASSADPAEGPAKGRPTGVTVRRLTAAAMLPFVAGPDRVQSASGPDEMVDILHLR